MDDSHLISSYFIQIYLQYPATYLSFADLFTYELVILFAYGFMIVFSFFTNLIAIIVFRFGRRSRSELSPFLLNLSVFNIIMTVYCIPFTITSLIFQRWLFARELCSVLDGFKTFSVSGVLLTLITIAIDRYCAVKYPLILKTYSTRRRNCVALLIIWILSIVLAVLWSPARSVPTPQKRLWVDSRTLLTDYINLVDNATDMSEAEHLLDRLQYQVINTIQCVPNKREGSVEVQRSILNCLQTYFIPLFILAFVYLRIATMLWQRSNHRHYEENETSSSFTSTTNTGPAAAPTASINRHNLFIHESAAFKKKLKQVRNRVCSIRSKKCASESNELVPFILWHAILRVREIVCHAETFLISNEQGASEQVRPYDTDIFLRLPFTVTQCLCQESSIGCTMIRIW